MDKRILVITDFLEGVELQKDSGTPTLKYFLEALSKEVTTTIVSPTRTPRKLNWFRWVRSFRKDVYDVDLVYGAGCASSYIAANLGRKFGIPSVGRLYGTYLYPHLNNPIQLTIKFEETLAFKAGCTKYIITNDGTRGDQVADHFGIPKEDLYFLRNGIDIPDVPWKPNEVPIIISLARLEKWKRVDRVIKAFSKCLYLNAKLWIVGGGPEFSNLLGLSDYDIHNKISFADQIPRINALRMLTRADIFISTNDYSNVSNSLLQAMEMGKCCIVLRSGDEIIEHGVTGLVAEREEELPGLIQYAVSNQGMRIKLGMEAMGYARDHFEPWDTRIQREVDIVRSLL